MLAVNRVEDIDGIRSLSRPWEQLLSRSPNGSLFVSHTFVTTWWEFFGESKRMWTLVARDGNDIVGIAPMMVARQSYSGIPARILGLINNKHVSRSDFMATAADRPRVLDAFVRYIQAHRSEWDVLRLVHVPSDTPKAIDPLLSGAAMRTFPSVPSRTLFHLPVAGTWDQYCSNQPHNMRKNFKNYNNRLAAAGRTRTSVHRSVADLDASLQPIWKVQELSWKHEDEVALSGHEQQYHLALAKCLSGTSGGGYENRVLYLNDQPIAALHSLIHNRVIYLMQTCYDQACNRVSPGWHVFGSLIRAFFENGEVDEIDFNGNTAFVQGWATASRTFEVMSACNNGPYSWLIGALKVLKRTFATGEKSYALAAAR